MKIGSIGCGTLIVLVAACLVFAYARDEESFETIRITGEIEVSDAGACSDDIVLEIRPNDAPTTTVTFEGGTGVTPCRLQLDGDIPVSNEYTFTIDGVASQTIRASLIDTIGDDGETMLHVELRW